MEPLLLIQLSQGVINGIVGITLVVFFITLIVLIKMLITDRKRAKVRNSIQSELIGELYDINHYNLVKEKDHVDTLN